MKLLLIDQCFYNPETGYFEPCCEAHEQEYELTCGCFLISAIRDIRRATGGAA
jgi:hypothetical protein